MPTTRTTNKNRRDIEEPEAQHLYKHTQAIIETAIPGIMRNSDMLVELRRQSEEITLLSQKCAAFEERAFQMQSTIKELKAQLHVDIKELYDQVQDTRSRLKEVVKMTRNLESASRNEARKHIAEVIEYVQEQQEQKQKHKDVNLVNAKEEDVQSTTSQNMRAEGMMNLLEAARSEIGTTVSDGPRFW
jgi:hypothetical protein